ncbi:DUF4350 domain-containing protein [Blastomonas sp.]|uniref:DUF4350 domain-containing protein n=1 Tax=Blastomonas sp. TaxID=1909299 RepID=UPI00391A3719
MATGGNSNPFARGTVLLMVAIGFAAFLALLYAIGAGGALRSGNNGAAHGVSVSTIGYSALAQLLEKTGTKVSFGRGPDALQQQDLLIVTPEISADPQELAALVRQRAFTGPTIIILPKWQVTPEEGLKTGWVRLESPVLAEQTPRLLSQLVPVRIRLEGMPSAPRAPAVVQRETAADRAAKLKVALRSRVTISGAKLKTVLADGATGRARVVVIDDGGWYPALDANAPENPDGTPDIEQGRYPVVIVADADLMNNKGLANRDTARQAVQIVDAAWSGGGEGVVFDLTQNGLGTSENLLSVAFRPPFVGAVASLALAAIGFAWMAFCRFGPALAEERPFGFGKTMLVKGSAGLVRRLGRDHLLGPAYADLVRERAGRSLGLPQGLPREQIDERLAKVSPDAEGRNYETLSADMRAARDRPGILSAARALYAWKKERVG